jgi:hypothetical protein
MRADTKSDARNYFGKPDPKAFAFSPEKGTYWAIWGSSSVETAKESAMHTCEEHNRTPCMLFAVNNEIVWQPSGQRPTAGAPGGKPSATSIAPESAAEAPRAAELARAMPHNGGLCGSVGGAVFSHDDSRILSWGADNTVRLWDAATGRELVPAMRHDGGLCGGVAGAVFSDDDSRILSWGDNTVRLWDAATGHELVPTMRHDGGIEGRFAIQVAAVLDPTEVPDEWRQLVGRYQVLAGLELQAPTTVTIPGKGTFYRVIGGVFATRAEAHAVCERLRSIGGDCMTVVL